MAFDPDAYLNSGTTKGFNPDAYLGNSSQDKKSSYLGDVISNIPGSALRTAQNFITPFIHPIDTAKSLGRVVAGGIEKLSPSNNFAENADVEKFDAFTKGLKDRYGDPKEFPSRPDALINTFKQDPVGAGADVAGVLMGGGKLAGMAGEATNMGRLAQAGRMASTAGELIDPLSLGFKAAGKLGDAGGSLLGKYEGMRTGSGGAISEAYKAGREGGAAKTAITDTMRGNVSGEQLAQDAVDSLQVIRRKRGADASAKFQQLKIDQTPIQTQPIKDKLEELLGQYDVKTETVKKPIEGGIVDANGRPLAFKTEKRYDLSESKLNDEGRADIQKMIDEVEQYTKNPTENLNKLDTLKRRIDDFWSPSGEARAFATNLKNTVKTAIIDAVPKYGEYTKGYQDASDVIKNIESELSLKQGKPAATTLRKLQQTLRDNFGLRKEFVQTLDDMGKKHLLEQIAGNQLQAATPKGLQSLRGGMIAGGMGLAAKLNPALLPYLAADLATSSPRLMGEAALGAGTIARRVAPIAAPIGKFIASTPFSQSMMRAGRLNNSTPYNNEK